MEIPKYILYMHTDLEVSVDIMFTNNLTLLVIMSKRLKFTTLQYTQNRTEKELDRFFYEILDVF